MPKIKSSISKEDIEKYKKTGASVGGALGYIIPVPDRLFEKSDYFDTKTEFKYTLDSNGLRVKKTPTNICEKQSSSAH